MMIHTMLANMEEKAEAHVQSLTQQYSEDVIFQYIVAQKLLAKAIKDVNTTNKEGKTPFEILVPFLKNFKNTSHKEDFDY